MFRVDDQDNSDCLNRARLSLFNNLGIIVTYNTNDNLTTVTDVEVKVTKYSSVQDLSRTDETFLDTKYCKCSFLYYTGFTVTLWTYFCRIVSTGVK